MHRTLFLGTDGKIRYLDDGRSRFEGEKASEDSRRVSHIVPVSWFLWLAFRLLRFAFGDKGRVAAWTRSWGCHWLLDLTPSGGARIKPFMSRAKAVEYEEKWLTDQMREGRLEN